MKEIEQLREKKDELENELLEKISDVRSSSRVKEIVAELFKYFPDCNGIVLMAAYKGDRGERSVYGFEEVEESVYESQYFEELDDELVTMNAWITNNRPAKWDEEIDKLFEELIENYPYPEEKEFDWDEMELGEKFEILLLKTGEYV